MTYRRFQVYFFVTVLVLSAALTLYMFKPYLTLLAFGGVLAIVAEPMHRYIRKFIKSDMMSALVTVIILALTILLPLVFFLAALTGELVNIFGNVRNYFDSVSLSQFLERIMPESLHNQIPIVMDEALSIARRAVEFFSANLVALFSNVFSIFFSFIVILISIYYLLRDGKKVKKELLALSPLGDEYDELVFKKIVVAVRAVMGGVLIIGLIKGIIAGFFFWILGVPAPLFWGSLTGVAAFIPIVGSSLVTIPAAGYLFIIGNYGGAIGLIVISVAIIGMVDNFLQPKLVESKTKIHPLLILLSILGGLQFYGFSGFILGPLTLAVTMALIDIYKKEFRNYIENIDKPL